MAPEMIPIDGEQKKRVVSDLAVALSDTNRAYYVNSATFLTQMSVAFTMDQDTRQ